ncbi:Fatty acyl-CoA reductase [Gryllus bimaculatus]|nr:Fatty acyl-CoA reductase [Gryllus bimaculatus]
MHRTQPSNDEPNVGEMLYADRFPGIAFVHLSTAFCHPTQAVLEERCYPPPAPPQDLLRLADWLDEDALNSLAPRLLGAHPNCYTFSKQLAESLVNDARGRMPVIIVRPSIVLPALEEPVAGWVDTLNGPMGLVAGAGKGVIRSMLVGRHFLVEVVPVDIAANAIICAAWDGALRGKEQAETPVYNLTSGDMVRVTWGEVLEVGRKLVYEEPFEGVVWYPDGDIRDSRLAHELIVFFFHVLPAYRRVRVGLELLQYFTTRQWRFATARARSLEARLRPRERRLLRLSVRDLDVEAALRAMLLGTRQLYVIHQLTKLLFWGALVYVPLMYITIFRTTLDAVCTQVFGNIPFPIVPIK